jgi:hypothetical protein
MHHMVLENDRSHYFGLFGPFSYCEIMTELNKEKSIFKICYSLRSEISVSDFVLT